MVAFPLISVTRLLPTQPMDTDNVSTLITMALSFPLALLSNFSPILSLHRRVRFVHFPNWTRHVNRSSTVTRCHPRPLKLFAYCASFLRSLTVFFVCVALHIYSYVRRPFLSILYFFFARSSGSVGDPPRTSFHILRFQLYNI